MRSRSGLLCSGIQHLLYVWSVGSFGGQLEIFVECVTRFGRDRDFAIRVEGRVAKEH